MNIEVRHITELLAKHGIKPSAQRIAVMRYMLTHHTHPTVDEIYRALVPEYPTMSRTTVYNTLKLMVENRCITGLSIDSANARFDGVTEPHAHFMCKQCGRITDIPLDRMPMAPSGMEWHETEVYFRGLCENCITKINHIHQQFKDYPK